MHTQKNGERNWNKKWRLKELRYFFYLFLNAKSIWIWLEEKIARKLSFFCQFFVKKNLQEPLTLWTHQSSRFKRLTNIYALFSACHELIWKYTTASCKSILIALLLSNMTPRKAVIKWWSTGCWVERERWQI